MINRLKKYLKFIFILTCGTLFSQEKNKANIDNYLSEKFSLNSTQYQIKSSVETNPNYDVYYVQQKFNNLGIHNAISTMSIKNGEIKSYKDRFVDESYGKSSLLTSKRSIKFFIT